MMLSSVWQRPSRAWQSRRMDWVAGAMTQGFTGDVRSESVLSVCLLPSGLLLTVVAVQTVCQ